jgi:hypothetical protein
MLHERCITGEALSKTYGLSPTTVANFQGGYRATSAGENVAYIGMTYSESRAWRTGDLIAAQWTAIIEKPSMFWRVQELIGERRVRRIPGRRGYAFGRLLWCVQCGEPMRATTTRGHAYYHCRRDVAQRCPSQPLRDDVLNAWATALFDQLESMQPAAVASAVEGERSRRSRRRAPSNRSAADTARRRMLLGVLFDKLYVEDQEITKYVARREYCQEVQALVELAVGEGLEYEIPVTGRGANRKRLPANASDLSVFGGKGGVLLRVSLKLEAAPG